MMLLEAFRPFVRHRFTLTYHMAVITPIPSITTSLPNRNGRV